MDKKIEFNNEDPPSYSKAIIIPYWHVKSTNAIHIYLRKTINQQNGE
jgi:hypothetical protein